MNEHKRDKLGTIYGEVGAYDRDYHELEETIFAVSSPLFAVTVRGICMNNYVTRRSAKLFSVQSGLSQANILNEKGVQQTTLSDPLLNFTYKTKYAFPDENIVITAEILLSRLQGHLSPSLCNFKIRSIIFIDRGYMSFKLL